MTHFLEIMCIIVFGGPIAGASICIPMLIWTHHRRKMEELRMKGGRMMAEDIRTEFATLRSEIRDLRDTSMQYDLSFDTALQQMERRVSKMERGGYVDTEASTQHNVSLGGR